MRSILLSIFGRLPIPVRRRVAWLVKSKYNLGVLAVVLDERGRVLLLRHRFRESGGWELPGGFIERGETLEGAIRRELLEETGLDVTVWRVVRASVPRPLHVEVCFLAHLTGGTLKLELSEITDARFFARDELPGALRADQLQSIDLAMAEAMRGDIWPSSPGRA